MAAGTVMSDSMVSCVVPGRGAGMRTLEVTLSKDGEMSRSGMQVEYAGIGEVTSLQPSAGVVTGGSVVTVSGTGFVAGRTACKFGSGSAFMASVMSSTEARCVAPAGVRGSVGVEVVMGESEEAALISTSGQVFTYEGAATVLEVSPRVAVVEGGSVVSVWCQECRMASRHGAWWEAMLWWQLTL